MRMRTDGSNTEPRPSVRKNKYAKPYLRDHGDLVEITKSEYGLLEKALVGSIFAMSSPALPGNPTR